MAGLKISESVSLSGINNDNKNVNKANLTDFDISTRLWEYEGRKVKVNKIVTVKVTEIERKLNIYQTVFVCDECQKIFKTISALTGHHHEMQSLKVKEEEEPEKAACVTETEKLVKPRNLKNRPYRKIPMRKGKAFHCKTCPDVFENREKLTTHIDLKHPSSRKYKCDLCSSSFNRMVHIVIHMKSHEKFPRIRKKPKPYTKRRRGGEKAFKCDQCDHSFHSQNGLSVHKDYRHPDGRSHPHMCHQCVNSYQIRENLERHIKSVHEMSTARTAHPRNKDGKLECKYCEKVFNFSPGLKRHLDLNHLSENDQVKRHSCSFCPSSFTFRQTLHEHIRSKHKGSRSFKCKFCDAAFDYPAKLSIHVDASHPEEGDKSKKYLCDKCPASFQFEVNLRLHIKSHKSSNLIKKKKKTRDSNDQKNFSCSTCGKKFFTDFGLFTHIDNQHEDVNKEKRKHLCKQCPSRFRFAATLQRHIKRHAKSHQAPEKFKTIKIMKRTTRQRQNQKKLDDSFSSFKVLPKYPCTVCNKTYNSTFGAKLHADRMHQIAGDESKKFHCDQCLRSFVYRVNMTYHFGKPQCRFNANAKKEKKCANNFTCKHYGNSNSVKDDPESDGMFDVDELLTIKDEYEDYVFASDII